MPRQGQSVESCILTEWKVQTGDTVAEGDVLAVIETDKASFDLESTASGTVLELFWEADDDVPVLANVLVMEKRVRILMNFDPQILEGHPPLNRLRLQPLIQIFLLLRQQLNHRKPLPRVWARLVRLLPELVLVPVRKQCMPEWMLKFLSEPVLVGV